MLDFLMVVATLCIAIFAGLTWRTYRQIRNLQRQSNEILDRTASLSVDLLEETRRARQERVRPAIRLTDRQWHASSKEGRSEIDVRLVNIGIGFAYEIRILEPLLPDGEQQWFDFLEPGSRREATLEIPGEYSPPETKQPLPYRVRIWYRDLYGVVLETIQMGTYVKAIAREVLADNVAEEERSSLKLCPHCGEQNRMSAERCRFCAQEL